MPSLKPAEPIAKAALKRLRLTTVGVRMTATAQSRAVFSLIVNSSLSP